MNVPVRSATTDLRPGIFASGAMPREFFLAAAAVPGPRDVLHRNLLYSLVISLLASHMLLAWTARPPGILTAQDDVEYIVLAQSLREGSYRERFHVDTPVHAQYPPGYPALLAAWGGVFGDSHDALVALSTMLSAATLLLTFATAGRLLGPTAAALVLAALAFNPATIEMAGGIRSEAAYALLSLAALYVLLPGDARLAAPPRRGFLAGAALAFLAVFTRTIGVTLLAALALAWLVQRRFRAVLWLSAVCAIPLLLWLAWTASAPQRFVGSSYIAELGVLLSGGPTRPPLPARTVENVIEYVTRSVPWHLGIPALPGTIVDNFVLSVLLGVLVIAGALQLRRRWPAAIAYLCVYGVVLSIWLWSIDRFVIPVVPLLVVLLFGAATHPMFQRAKGGPAAVLAAIAAILIVGGLSRTLPLASARLQCDRGGALPDRRCVTPAQASYLDAIEWIGVETQPGAVVLAAKPGALYWYTGRTSISFPAALAADERDFVRHVRAAGARYIVLGDVDTDQEPRLARRLEANCESLSVEATFDSAAIFSLRDPDAAPDCERVRAAIQASSGSASGD